MESTAFHVFLLFACIVACSGSSCTTNYGGVCKTLFDSCPSGYLQSFSHCGFLEMCCYPQTTSHNTGSHSGSQTGSHTGTGGSTGTPGSSGTSSGSSGSCGHPLVTGSHKIVGGSTSTPGEYPWQVSLRYAGQHMCGGTLIDNRWVLTAAHCFEGTSARYWTVAVGIHDRAHVSSTSVHHASLITLHASYSKRTNANDIAMIKLDKPVDISGKYVRPACLPSSNEDFTNVVCTVTGWGATHDGGQGTRYMLEVDVPVITNSLCSYYLGSGHVHSTNLCAGYRSGGHDACQGDSGGPLVCKKDGSWKLAGIVSWGYGCAQRYAPGVYTRVASYIDWINKVKARHP